MHVIPAMLLAAAITVNPEAVISARFGSRAAPALKVARCESRLNPLAVNRRTGTRGLFQIAPVHWSKNGLATKMGYGPADMFDPVKNANVAFALSRGGTSWKAWACKP